MRKGEEALQIKKAIWLTDNKKYFEQINGLINELYIEDIALEGQYEIDTLQYYNLVVFLLNPLNIGNKFFLEGVNSILEKRKSSRTILFMINDVHALSTQDILNLKIELMKSLEGIIENPAIQFCSTLYGNLYFSYIKNEKTLEDLRKENSLMIPTFDGTYLTGKDIKEEHMEEIQRLSCMKNVSEIISTYVQEIQNSNIDVSKKNMLVIGQKSVGKTMLANIIRRLYGESIFVSESNDMSCNCEMLFDMLIVVIDLDIEKEFSFVEEVCSEYISIDKLFVINKTDNFMFYGRSKKETISIITNQMHQLGQDRSCFISAYYIKQLLDLEDGTITNIDVINDSDVVFEDILGFPICKEKNKRRILELLKEASGYNELLKHLEA